MAEPNLITPPNLTAWKAETLRMTAILSPSTRISEQSWWQDLLGELPETKVSQPKTGVKQEEGNFERGRLFLGIHPSRIDWFYTVDISLAMASFELSSIESFVDSLDPFVNLMLRWLEISPALQRLAFGTSILLPTENEQDAYRRISSYLPVKQSALDEVSDFLYQINRRRSSTSDIDGLHINCLSKWSVVQWVIQVLPNINSFQSNGFGCQLELDINTIPNENNLPTEKLPQIFHELVDIGKEIILKGDV